MDLELMSQFALTLNSAINASDATPSVKTISVTSEQDDSNTFYVEITSIRDNVINTQFEIEKDLATYVISNSLNIYSVDVNVEECLEEIVGAIALCVEDQVSRLRPAVMTVDEFRLI